MAKIKKTYMEKREYRFMVIAKLKRTFQWLVIICAWTLFLLFIISPLIWPYAVFVQMGSIVIYVIVKIVAIVRFRGISKQNSIVFGSRGSGKGLIFQYAINSELRAISNIPYGEHVSVIAPQDYFESIKPNTFQNVLSGHVVKVNKVPEWEKIPYYLDDTAVMFPNIEDTFLKKNYKSMPLFITVQRHLYDTYTMINGQSIDRIVKYLRELQMDGLIKALKTLGKGYVWRHCPILRKIFIVKYRFYENLQAAEMGKVPFGKLGIVQPATDTIFMSTASALKAQYEGENGKIFDGILFIGKKSIKYDTRYYQTVFFNEN